MEIPTLLKTKLCSPLLRQDHIHRPLLSERLNCGIECKVTLISALSGFGKSSLVSEWVLDGNLPSVWYSLDPSDNSISQFLLYFIGALQKIDSTIGAEILASLLFPRNPNPEAIMTVLINQISELKEKFLFILDDYHHIHSREIDEVMHFLISNIPPSMHLVILSRDEPPIPLSPLKARGELSELRTDDLRFNLDDTVALFRNIPDLSLSPEDIEMLNEKTGGWIAGLQLAAISLEAQKNKAGFIATISGRHECVSDYLIEEVFQSLSEPTQQYLITTSILNRVCSSLSNAVAFPGSLKSGRGILEELDRLNPFIIPLDHEQIWFRFHSLLRDFLYQRLLDSCIDVELLHKRASLWLEENGLLMEALSHNFEAGDSESATRLIAGKAHVPGIGRTILSWLDSHTEEEQSTRPELLVIAAIHMLGFGQVSGVEEMLNRAEKAYREKGSGNLLMKGRIIIARATLKLSDYNFESIRVYAKFALKFIPKEVPFLSCSAKWMLGVYFLNQKNLKAGKTYFEEALKESKFSANLPLSMLSAIGLGHIGELSNHLYKAAEYYKETLIVLSGVTAEVPFLGESHLGLARLHYQWNQLEEASKHAGIALKLFKLYDSDLDRVILAELFLARLKRIQGDKEQFFHLLMNVEKKIAQNGFERRKKDAANERVFGMLENNQIEEARILSQQHGLWFVEGKILLHENKAEEALAFVKQQKKVAKDRLLPIESLQIKILQLLAYHQLNQDSEIISLLPEVLSIAQDGGFVRIFLDEGPPMETLLREASRKRDVFAYLQTLLTAFESEKIRVPMVSTFESETPHIIDTLSPREREVLALISEGYSNKEISDLLCMALDTVKGHNRKIFQKLNVENRIQAVNVAKDLKLIC